MLLDGIRRATGRGSIARMVKTTHLRAPLADVLAALDAALAPDGYAPSDLILAPRVVPLGNGESISMPPEVPPDMRRLVIAERDGWVTIADDPFATTDWGARLSAAFAGAPVIVLEGECDHAFYSSVVLYEDGAATHTSTVPQDAIHEDDGRHRIRPLFLADHFSGAREALERGIVVNKLGGEENVSAVADVIGLPNALLSAHDEAGDGRVDRLYAFDSARAPRPDPQAAMQSALAALLGGATGLGALGLEGAAASDLFAELARGFIPGARGEETLGLHAPLSSNESGHVGDAHRFHTTFLLAGPHGSRARDVTIRVGGTGLGCFDVSTITIASRGVDPSTALDVTPRREGETLVAQATDIELSIAAPLDPDLDSLPSGERGRRAMNMMRSTPFGGDPAEIVVHLTGMLVREGAGKIEIQADAVASDGQALSATSTNRIEVKPALRVPVLPAPLDDEARANLTYALDTYAARAHANGWLAFDRLWSEVGELVTSMARDLCRALVEMRRSDPRPERVVLEDGADEGEIGAALDRGAEVFVAGPPLMRVTRDDDCTRFDVVAETPGSDVGFRADVLCKGGERLDFPAPIDVGGSGDASWRRVVAELERGADVSLAVGPYDDEVRVEIVHQPEGSNYFPDPASAGHAPRVQLAWSCPRPAGNASRATLGELARDILLRAGRDGGHLGGVAFASGQPIRGSSFDLPYDDLLGDRARATESAWLGTHVRSPGWVVLVPAGATRSLAAPGDGVERVDLEHGALLVSRAADPFSYSDADAEAMERAVVGAQGLEPPRAG